MIMRYIFAIFFFALFLTGYAQSSDIPIRVLLTNIKPSFSNSKAQTYVFESSTPFHIFLPTNQPAHIVSFHSKIFLTIANNNLFLHSPGQKLKKIGSPFIISNQNSHLRCEGKEFNGTITVHQGTKKPLFINTLSLEDYIYSVIRFEIFQSWPLEMQKVQAVASRTFAFHHLLKSRKNKKLYDIKNSSSTHQHYGGWHPYEHVKKAVEETKNIILLHNNKPALTMFDICCGGIITADMKTDHFTSAPYLARKNRCLHCQKYKFYTWSSEYDINNLEKKMKTHPCLHSKMREIGRLKEIVVREKDKAGRVHKLTVCGTKKSMECSGQHFLECMKPEMKSVCFSITKKGNKNIMISGKGFGHQLGICQRGAYELVKKGWNFKKILSFYYPTTIFAHLNPLYEYA